ncbi:MAG: AAA family ATPase [Candidatus Methanoplasma sp.]|jgi:dephospho-CoA kinase|nr:AAA family ATPase [Candidatus Methanoplasma sp.]
MSILIVAGMPGAGKEEFLDVARGKGMPFLRMGDVVREFHAASGTSVSVGEFAGSERAAHGANIWAERSVERMEGGTFLVDGCRSMSEVGAFRSLGGDVRVIGIHSPPGQRFDRLVKRGRADAPRNREEFEERDRRELSWGIGDVLALSDLMISNASTLESFHMVSDDVLEGLR